MYPPNFLQNSFRIFATKLSLQDMEVQQRKKYPNWAEEQRKKAAELARVRAIREKKMDRNKKEVSEGKIAYVVLNL